MNGQRRPQGCSRPQVFLTNHESQVTSHFLVLETIVKLATLKDGTRDGRLIVASRDLQSAAVAPEIAGTLQHGIDHWDEVAPRLQEVYERLNAGKANAFHLDLQKLAAPLPRAPQWLDGSAFHSHGDLMEKVFGLQPVEG